MLATYLLSTYLLATYLLSTYLLATYLSNVLYLPPLVSPQAIHLAQDLFVRRSIVGTGWVWASHIHSWEHASGIKLKTKESALQLETTFLSLALIVSARQHAKTYSPSCWIALKGRLGFIRRKRCHQRRSIGIYLLHTCTCFHNTSTSI